MEWHTDSITVTTDPEKMDRQKIFEFLHQTAYWSKGIPYDICMNALDHSVPFSIVNTENHLVGFARLVTDHATFSYLCDVFILEEYRGQGFGKFLVQCINAWIDERNLRTSLLLTRDAQSLYEGYDWVYFPNINRVMRYREAKQNFYNYLK